MIGFSDVRRYITDAPAVSRFKPWWEITLDLLSAGLFLIMILAWSRSYSVEAGGLICVPLEGDASSVATADVRYIQSRCNLESSIRIIEFYPYVLLLQWMMIFLCQISWIWIPSVIAKFAYFYNIFNEIMSVEPTFVFNLNNYCMLPEIDYIDENREKLKFLHDKIILMLMDKSNLSLVYKRKCYTLTTVIIISLVPLILLLIFSNLFESNFNCTLKGGHAKKSMYTVVCNISPQLYLYGILILHVFILLLMLSFSLIGLIWYHSLLSRLKNNTDRLFSGFSDDYKGLPGGDDLFIFLDLLNSNLRDGNLMMSTIIYVLNSKYIQTQSVVVKNNIATVVKSKNQLNYSYMEEYCIVNLIASELGVNIGNYEQNSNSLYNYLSDLWKKLEDYTFYVEDNIQTAIYNEIYQNIAYYTSFSCNDSDIIRTGDDKIQSPDNTIMNEIKLMVSGNKWPNHLILLAAANVLKLKFILITAIYSNDGNLFYKDNFSPSDPRSVTQPPILLIYISPHYYYRVEMQSGADLTQESNRTEFIRNKKFRDRLRHKAARRVADVRHKQPEKVRVRKHNLDQNKAINHIFETQHDSMMAYFKAQESHTGKTSTSNVPQLEEGNELDIEQIATIKTDINNLNNPSSKHS